MGTSDKSLIKLIREDEKTVIITFLSSITKSNFSKAKKELLYALGEEYSVFIVDLAENVQISAYLIKLLINLQKSIEIENRDLGVILDEQSRHLFEVTNLAQFIFVDDNKDALLEKLIG